MGVFVVGAVLLLTVGYFVWRRMLRKVDEKPTSGDGGSS
jgi:cytochrome c oxidase assembly factor CtaG